ncbi:MAG: hypothetical protein Q8O55_03720 [Dehalococcoidales bacterium]|nr:hypothetical protein [Dehalococcoidales bacterium]
MWKLEEKRIEPAGGSWEKEGINSGTISDTRFTYQSLQNDLFNAAIKKREPHYWTYIWTYTFSELPETLTSGETVTIKVTGTASYSGDEPTTGNSHEIWFRLASTGVEPMPAWLGEQGDKVVFNLPANSGTTSKSISFVVPPVSPAGEIQLNITLGLHGIFRVYRVGETAKTESQAASPRETAETKVKNINPYMTANLEEILDPGEEIYIPEWLEWIRPKQPRIQSRGYVIPQRGDIFVYNRTFKRWDGPISSERELLSGDIVATGKHVYATIGYTSQQGTGYATVLGAETLIVMPSTVAESKWPTLWSIYEGAVRIKRIYRGETPPPEENPLLLHSGEITVGTRGTDFIVYRDPETQTSTIHVNNGELNYYNLVKAGPDSAILSAGQSLVIKPDGTETITPLSLQEWDALVTEYGLEEPPGLIQEELDRLLAEKNGESSGASAIPVIIGIGSVVVVVLAFFWLKKRPKKD